MGYYGEAFRQQKVGVRGRLFCGSEPLNSTQLKLWNKNTLGTDDQLASTKTDSNGNYQMEGGIGGILKLDVFLKIYHDCDDGIKPCQRKVVFGIPSDYITRSQNLSQYFEAGSMNMQFKFPDEERSCIN